MQKFLALLNPFTKATLLIALALIVYGFLCRWFGIYFFWESDYIGTAIMLISVVSFLITSIRRKKAQNRKVIAEKLIIGLILFVVLLFTGVMIAITNSDAYAAAKKYLQNNRAIITELGQVKGFGFTPAGSVQMHSSNNTTSGIAELNILVKGDKKYKEMTVLVAKEQDKADWEVAIAE